MRAIVLVGGFGTRLRPLTSTRPKQMLPVVGRLMIERVVSELGRHGVTDAILSLGYRPDAFLGAYPDDLCSGVRLHYAVEPEPLDTAGAVRFAAEAAGIDGRFVVVNGDVLTDLDVGHLWRAHEESGAEATIALTRVDDPSRYGVVPIEPEPHGAVTAFVEKPPADEAPTDWINAGTYVLEASVLERIPATPTSIERRTFPEMVLDGALWALQSSAYWIDAGTPQSYLQAQLDLIDGTRDREPGVSPDAQVADGAELDDAVVMAGATVAAGATVRRAVVMAGARIGPGAVVDGSLIGPGATVGAGAVVSDLTVLGDGADVPSGAVLSGARVPEPA